MMRPLICNSEPLIYALFTTLCSRLPGAQFSSDTACQAFRLQLINFFFQLPCCNYLAAHIIIANCQVRLVSDR